MANFTILHLSDSHIGNPRTDLDARDLFESLIDDIRDRASSIGKPDLILFTGDLAYGRTDNRDLRAEYVQAREFLDNVVAAANSTADRPLVFLVPGNHDSDRKSMGVDQTNWLNSLRTQGGQEADEVVYEEMRKASVTWTRFLERQKEWTTFCVGIDAIRSGIEHVLWDYPTRIAEDCDRRLQLRMGLLRR